MAPVYFALTLLHCKNVKIQEPEVDEKVVAKRRKEGKPTIRYKVLEVDALKQKLKTQYPQTNSQFKNALHICRGHWKDFREGPGLFGKIKGLFWWEMHSRGDVNSGIVDKDYRVNA